MTGYLSIFLIAVCVISFFLEALFLYLATKMVKVENSTYRKAFKVAFFFLLGSFLISIISSVIYTLVGVEIFGYVLFLLGGCLLANILYKKYYGTSTRKNIKIYIAKSILSISAVLMVALPIRIFVAEPFIMKGASMSPNFKEGAYMIFNRYEKKYDRGDVIAFRSPKSSGAFLIKRIVGLPGDKVEIRQGAVFINGNIFNEAVYLKKDEVTSGETDIVLGKDEYFVMGDNRSNSADSRGFGAIQKSEIVGKYWNTLFLLYK